ncbi:MAG TPA: rod shape-determining protein RodA [Acidimicrobiia bacterium]|nr:rod shape-determining protein RodA [Acidimicrobiia bacterium]
MALTKSLTAAKKQLSAKPWRQVDVVLLGAVGALSVLGCLMIYSASRSRLAAQGFSRTYFLERQIGFVLVGIMLMFFVMSIDYRKMRDMSPLIYIGVVGMLLLVLSPLGSAANGTQGWFSLPGGFQLQPSEFSKFFLIIVLASYISQNEQFHIPALIRTLAIAIVPIGLVLLQPDLGTAMVLGAISIGMLSVAGTRGRYLLVLAIFAIVSVVGVLQMGVLKQYQVDRLTVFLNQDADKGSSAYNVDQSKTAIGNGGMVGKGLFKGEQTNLSYVPEQHTDFIFTAIGEELGFLGSTTVLGLFGIIAWRMWRISRAAPDATGTLICIGVVSMFVFHVFENIGMTMGIMPITGIPLPFVSYGGSAVLLMFMAVGLVNNIYMHRYE